MTPFQESLLKKLNKSDDDKNATSTSCNRVVRRTTVSLICKLGEFTYLLGINIYIATETCTQIVRPYLPQKFRRLAFDSIHNLSHPGIKTTRTMVANTFFGPGLNRDFGHWAKTCFNFLKVKLNRHSLSKFEKIAPADRFEHTYTC